MNIAVAIEDGVLVRIVGCSLLQESPYQRAFARMALPWYHNRYPIPGHNARMHKESIRRGLCNIEIQVSFEFIKQFRLGICPGQNSSVPIQRVVTSHSRS